MFNVGDRVLHKSGGSAKHGADARVGVVKAVRLVPPPRQMWHTTTERVPILDIDWPAPNRIGGDGWHRSTIKPAGVILATADEVERRRAINRERNARLEAEARARIAARQEAKR